MIKLECLGVATCDSSPTPAVHWHPSHIWGSIATPYLPAPWWVTTGTLGVQLNPQHGISVLQGGERQHIATSTSGLTTCNHGWEDDGAYHVTV